MAQQTQVRRVVPFFNGWIKKFPTLTSLARASKPEVLAQWSGLGYNNRALRLHRLSKEIVGNSGARLPRDVEALLRLPGIGKYTAHAIACFAFGEKLPVVDVNVRRVFSRVFWKISAADDLKPEKVIWELAAAHLPSRGVSEWNQALMDLGAVMCTARNPRCHDCPINDRCASAFAENFAKKTRARKKDEPSFKGIPRRIYRGRILKALHQKPLTLRQLGASVVRQFHPRDIKWIESVVHKMQHDDLVIIRGAGGRRIIRIAQ